MKKLLLFLATVAVATSCEKDILADVATPDSSDAKQITISASTEGAATRVNVSDDGAAGYNVEWKADDKLGGWAWDGPYSNSTFNKFTIAEGGYGATNSTFTGSISHTTDASIIRFVHPYTTTALNVYEEKEVTSSSGYVYTNKYYYGFDINLANQEAGALNDNTYMVSNKISGSSADGASLSMTHLGAMMELNFKALNDLTLYKVVVKDIPTIASVDLRADDDVVAQTTAGDMTITVGSNVLPIDGIYTVAFNILPFTVASGTALEVVSYYKKSDDTYYSATTQITASNDVTFARATRNSVNVLVTESDLVGEAAPVELTETTITGSDFYVKGTNGSGYTSNNGEWDYQGITLQVTDCYNNNSGIQMKSGSGIFYNTLALNGLAEIELAINSSVAPTLPVIYAGSEQNPTTEIDGVNGVYTIPDGCSYFKVAAFNGAYVVLSSITFKYVSIEGALPSISTDTTSITFEPEADTFDVELAKANCVGTEEITASSDNSQFTTSVSGTTVTVAAVANNTDAPISGTISISIDGGNTIEIPVSQKTASVSYAPTTTVDATYFAGADDTQTNIFGKNESVTTVAIDTTNITFAFAGTATNPAAYYYTSEVGNLRIYNGEDMTIATTDGSLITSIEITYTGTSYAKIISADCGEFSTSGTLSTWSGSSDAVKFTANGTNRIASIKIN